jgi:hypothetical protein
MANLPARDAGEGLPRGRSGPRAISREGGVLPRGERRHASTPPRRARSSIPGCTNVLRPNPPLSGLRSSPAVQVGTTIWDKLSYEEAEPPSENQPASEGGGSGSAITAPDWWEAWKRKRPFVDVIGAVLWIYAVSKAFVGDFDAGIVKSLVPDAQFLIDFRFFIFLALAIVAVLLVRPGPTPAAPISALGSTAPTRSSRCSLPVSAAARRSPAGRWMGRRPPIRAPPRASRRRCLRAARRGRRRARPAPARPPRRQASVDQE